MRLDAEAAREALADLDMLGVAPDAVIRVFGGYGRRLADAIMMQKTERRVRVPYQHVGYQLRQVAKYVAKHHAVQKELAA